MCTECRGALGRTLRHQSGNSPTRLRKAQGNWQARKKAAPAEIGFVSEIVLAAATFVRSATHYRHPQVVLLASSTTDLPDVTPLTSNTSWPPAFRGFESNTVGARTVMVIEFVTAASP